MAVIESMLDKFLLEGALEVFVLKVLIVLENIEQFLRLPVVKSI